MLVVDDHPDAADTLATLLLLIFECTTNTAHSGIEALALSERLRPDIVILDISMRQMDGCETARRMRERPWGRNACIIALSAWGDEDTRQRAKQAGMDIHLTKPVSVEDLQGALAMLRQ